MNNAITYGIYLSNDFVTWCPMDTPYHGTIIQRSPHPSGRHRMPRHVSEPFRVTAMLVGVLPDRICEEQSRTDCCRVTKLLAFLHRQSLSASLASV